MYRFSNILFVADSNVDNAADFARALAVANNNQAAAMPVPGLGDQADPTAVVA